MKFENQILLNTLGSKYNFSRLSISAELSLAWLTSKKCVGSIILGNRNLDQLKSSLKIFKNNISFEIFKEIEFLKDKYDFNTEFLSRPDPFLET